MFGCASCPPSTPLPRAVTYSVQHRHLYLSSSFLGHPTPRGDTLTRSLCPARMACVGNQLKSPGYLIHPSTLSTEGFLPFYTDIKYTFLRPLMLLLTCLFASVLIPLLPGFPYVLTYPQRTGLLASVLRVLGHRTFDLSFLHMHNCGAI